MKKNVFAGKSILAAGLIGALAVLGASPALAAGEKGAAQETAAAAGTAVDAEGAEKIAFADAGAEADKAERIRTETDREDGETVYEVSFTVEGVEYEYLIREADGAILEWEIDGRDVGGAVAEESLKSETAENGESKEEQQRGETLIGLERAKEIALEDAGVEAKDVSFSKIKFEKDKRTAVYEVEFYQDRQEFEYTIEAFSGEIRKVERD